MVDSKENKSFISKVGSALKKFIGDPAKLIDNSIQYVDDSMLGVQINLVPIRVRKQKPVPSLASLAGAKVETGEPKVLHLKPTVVVGRNEAMGTNCLCLCNVIAHNKYVVDWATENFGDKCSHVSNMWVKSTDTVLSKNDDSITAHELDICLDEPENIQGYNHMFVMYADDVNYLNYVKYEIEKYLAKLRSMEITLMNSNTKEHKLEVFAGAVEGLGGIDSNADSLLQVIYSTGEKLGLSKEEIDEIVEKNRK